MGFSRVGSKLAEALNLFAGCCLFGMVMLTCSDVVLRFFNHPILGAYEIMCFLSAGTAAFAMADATLNRVHVCVDVLVVLFSQKVQTIIYIITRIFSIFLFILICYECFKSGYNLQQFNELSMTLKLPYFPILYGISFASLVVCFILLIDIAKKIKEDRRPAAKGRIEG